VIGAGNVGAALVKFLFQNKAKKVKVWDISAKNLEELKKDCVSLGGELETTVIKSEKDLTDFYSSECDCLSLNATGGGLND